MKAQELIDTARILVAGDKGLLAMDESNPTGAAPALGSHRLPLGLHHRLDDYPGPLQIRLPRPGGKPGPAQAALPGDGKPAAPFPSNALAIKPRTGWLAKIRESMGTLTAQFSANHAIRQYTNEYYLPRAAAYESRRQNQSALGIRLTNWRRMLEKEWNSVSFGDLQIETRDGQHHFRVEVIFGRVDPEAVQVELCAAGPEGRALRQPMVQGAKLTDREGGYLFTAQVPETRPASDFTPRLIPYFSGVAVPLEIALILWHH
jgi:hypothetical protein